MVDPVTVNRGYAIPTRGSDVGTWDVPVNGDFNLIDQNLGAVTTLSTTGGSTTLTPTQLACGTIVVTGTLTSNAVLVFPAVQGWWTIQNLTTSSGNFGLFAFAGTLASGIGMPPGELIDIQVNTNLVAYRNLGRIGSYLDLATPFVVPAWISQSTIAPYLLCDGSAFSAGTYPVLASILGGTTLPDLRGVARYTLNGGTGRLTTAGSGLDGNTLLEIKTTQTQTLLPTNLPPYTPAGSVSVVSQSNFIVTNTQGFGSAPGGGSQGTFAQTSGVAASPQTSTGTLTGTPASGQNSTPFGVIGTGVVAGITLIRAA